MFKRITTPLIFLFLLTVTVQAQEARGITMEEYELAKTFEIEDLDNDTYVKFENKYILDRYEMRDPIYITGDDGKRKRVDVYKLVARQDLVDLGVMVFYTTETGTLYQTLIPNFLASGEVWEKYFEDIHAIDKVEDNFVLKLSYVLSREFSFQMMKSSGVESVTDEHATYGSDICFPGDQLVTLADGSTKQLKDVAMGDKVLSLDPVTQANTVVEVNKLVAHTPENYAITALTLISSKRYESDEALELHLGVKTLKATPNHPMLTSTGSKPIGEVIVGEEILSWNEASQQYETFEVIETQEITEGVQPVFSIEANEGTTLLMNGVMVKQKN